MELEMPIMQEEMYQAVLDTRRSEIGGLKARHQAMARLMLSTVSSILCANMFALAAAAQPTPEMAEAWRKVVNQKIEAKFNQELSVRHIELKGKTSLIARAYLEKDGRLKRLRIDKSRVNSDLQARKLQQVEDALISAIAASAPMPYANIKEGRLRHLGFFVKYDSQTGKIDAGLTHPEDCPAP